MRRLSCARSRRTDKMSKLAGSSWQSQGQASSGTATAEANLRQGIRPGRPHFGAKKAEYPGINSPWKVVERCMVVVNATPSAGYGVGYRRTAGFASRTPQEVLALVDALEKGKAGRTSVCPIPEHPPLRSMVLRCVPKESGRPQWCRRSAGPSWPRGCLAEDGAGRVAKSRWRLDVGNDVSLQSRWRGLGAGQQDSGQAVVGQDPACRCTRDTARTCVASRLIGCFSMAEPLPSEVCRG